MDEEWVELGRWHQRCGALAPEALLSPQVQTLYVTHMTPLHPHSDFPQLQGGTQIITSKELL